MKKEYLGYGLLGIIGGLILGFFIGNAVSPGTNAAPSNMTSGAGTESVNSGGPSQQQLPPNHPPIDSGQTIPAPPLSPGAGDNNMAGDTSGAASGSAESVALPSLDPLPAGNKDERTEQKYKNIQILKGLPADRLTKIMFAFKDSLGVDCTFCHIKDQFDKDDKPTKQMARKMITIVRDANAKLGSARISCFTCHRGQQRPPQ